MKKSKFSETQIVSILKQGDASVFWGGDLRDLQCRIVCIALGATCVERVGVRRVQRCLGPDACGQVRVSQEGGAKGHSVKLTFGNSCLCLISAVTHIAHQHTLVLFTRYGHDIGLLHAEEIGAHHVQVG